MIEGLRHLVSIDIFLRRNIKTGGDIMSDFETLTIMLMILNIIIVLFLEIIKKSKNNRP